MSKQSRALFLCGYGFNTNTPTSDLLKTPRRHCFIVIPGTETKARPSSSSAFFSLSSTTYVQITNLAHLDYSYSRTAAGSPSSSSSSLLLPLDDVPPLLPPSLSRTGGSTCGHSTAIIIVVHVVVKAPSLSCTSHVARDPPNRFDLRHYQCQNETPVYSTWRYVAQQAFKGALTAWKKYYIAGLKYVCEDQIYSFESSSPHPSIPRYAFPSPLTK